MTYTAIALVIALLAGALYGVWLANEERKADRKKFGRIAQANSESKPWQPPPRGPKGFDRNRRKAA